MWRFLFLSSAGYLFSSSNWLRPTSPPSELASINDSSASISKASNIPLALWLGWRYDMPLCDLSVMSSPGRPGWCSSIFSKARSPWSLSASWMFLGALACDWFREIRWWSCDLSMMSSCCAKFRSRWLCSWWYCWFAKTSGCWNTGSWTWCWGTKSAISTVVVNRGCALGSCLPTGGPAWTNSDRFVLPPAKEYKILRYNTKFTYLSWKVPSKAFQPNCCLSAFASVASISPIYDRIWAVWLGWQLFKRNLEQSKSALHRRTSSQSCQFQSNHLAYVWESCWSYMLKATPSLHQLLASLVYEELVCVAFRLRSSRLLRSIAWTEEDIFLLVVERFAYGPSCICTNPLYICWKGQNK